MHELCSEGKGEISEIEYRQMKVGREKGYQGKEL